MSRHQRQATASCKEIPWYADDFLHDFNDLHSTELCWKGQIIGKPARDVISITDQLDVSERYSSTERNESIIENYNKETEQKSENE